MNDIQQPSNSLIERHKDPIAVELGKRGGLATKRLYGMGHFKRISNLRWENRDELKIITE
jgi:hypothetical protein